MQSGATAFDIASYVAGKARATANAQARPAIAARRKGRASGREADKPDIANIAASR
jgi:hypothetical protein